MRFKITIYSPACSTPLKNMLRIPPIPGTNWRTEVSNQTKKLAPNNNPKFSNSSFQEEARHFPISTLGCCALICSTQDRAFSTGGALVPPKSSGGLKYRASSGKASSVFHSVVPLSRVLL